MITKIIPGLYPTPASLYRLGREGILVFVVSVQA